jgi:hypothetical protein
MAAKARQPVAGREIKRTHGSKPFIALSEKSRVSAFSVKSSRAPLQISPETKAKLDQIKQAAEVETYDEAIAFLYSFWKKSLPSLAGTLPGIGPFEREEDDPYRVPH